MRYLWYRPVDFLCAYNMLQHRQSFPRSWGPQLCDGLPARDAALSISSNHRLYTKAEKAMDAATYTVVLFTQRRHIIATVAVRQFSVAVCSHRAKQLWRKDKPLCYLHSKAALWLLMRHDGYKSLWWPLHVFKVFPRCPPSNLNPLTVYSHMDAVIMCCYWDLDLPNILESDKVTFSALNYIIAWLPSVKRMLRDAVFSLLPK